MLWEKLLSEKCSIEKLRLYARDELRLKKQNGKYLGRSEIDRLLKNPFYCGNFVFNKQIYSGKHRPLVTKEQFGLAQKILSDKSKPSGNKHDFPFIGLFKCRNCGCTITAEKKVKRQKNGNVHYYTYYRCTHMREPKCTEPAITDVALKSEIGRILLSLDIPESFHTWAMEILKKENDKKFKQNQILRRDLDREYNQIEKTQQGIIRMRANGEIDESEYKKQKKTI